MKKTITGILLIICTVFAQAAYADSLNVSMQGGDSLKAGETFELTVSYSCDNLDRVDAQLSYDTDVLSYISGGTSSGDGGVVSLKGASDNGRFLDFTVVFKAKAEGNVSIAAETVEAYDLDGNILNLPQISKNISVVEENTDNDEPKEEVDNKPESSEEPAESETGDKRETQNSNFLLICGIAATAFVLIIALCVAARRKRNR